VARQLAKSAPSIAANYRGTCNARSRKEFIAKLGVSMDTRCFRQELMELRAIFAKSLGTARANAKLAKRRKRQAKRKMTKSQNDQMTK